MLEGQFMNKPLSFPRENCATSAVRVCEFFNVSGFVFDNQTKVSFLTLVLVIGNKLLP